MKSFSKTLIATAAALVLVGGVSHAYRHHLTASPRTGTAIAESAPVKDTITVNTTKMGENIEGYAGTTPLEIKVYDGRVVSIKALPNDETPRFFQRVVKSDIFSKPVGLTVEEALKLELDAVTGATFSSKAVIANLRLGLSSVKKK